jgi:sugar transferase (PEP-CTERM system associated)
MALVDVILFLLAFYAGCYLYFLLEPGSFHNYLPRIPWAAALFAAVSVMCQAAMGLYEPRLREGASGVLMRTAGGFAAAAMILAAIFYALPELHLWRGIYFCTAMVAFAATLVNRNVFASLTDRERFKKRVLVYGAGKAASAITTAMRRRVDRRNFIIVGFVRVGDETARVAGERVINLHQPLADYARQVEIDQIVVALDDEGAGLPIKDLFQCRMSGVKVVRLVSFFEQEAGKILVDFVTPAWMAFADGFNCRRTSRLAKRGFDIFASCLLLAISWPLMLLTALAIWLEDGIGAPVLFRQERVRLHGRTFRVLKFRSMRLDAESDGNPRWATSNDQRVTRVGGVIRRLRIDELPQILNVLAGQMAFIGPRPERPQFVEELSRHIPYYKVRHCVKPGITGWAQLNYPYGASSEDAHQKLQFDLYYVKNHSLFLDLMICLTTVEVVLFGKGAR